MTNLFSTFDPQSWNSLSLNWNSALLPLLLLPSLFWVNSNQPRLIWTKIVTAVNKEFFAILNSNSVPGITILTLRLFVFIILNNTLGLLPYVFTASSHLTFTLRLALPLWVGHILLAWTKTPQHTLAHLVPLGTPGPLMPFIVFIEIIRNVIRPLTLAVRLAANIVAGHLLLSLLGGPAATLPWATFLALMASLIALTTLECAVRLIQSYVFRVLSTLYLNEVNVNAIS